MSYGGEMKMIPEDRRWVAIPYNDPIYEDIRGFLSVLGYDRKKVFRFFIDKEDGIVVTRNNYYFYWKHKRGADIPIPKLPSFKTPAQKVVEFVEDALGLKILEHQAEAFYKFHTRHPARSYITLPTGAGKSLILTLISLLLINEGYTVAYTVNNLKILGQFFHTYIEKIEKKLGGRLRVAYEGRGENPPNPNLIIASPVSLMKYINLNAPKPYLFLLVDEAHISHKNITYLLDKTRIVAGCIGSTATPPEKLIKNTEEYNNMKKLINFFAITYFNEIEVENKETIKELMVQELDVMVIYTNLISMGAKVKKDRIERIKKLLELEYRELSTSQFLGNFVSLVFTNTISPETIQSVKNILDRVGDEKAIIFSKSVFKGKVMYNSLLKDATRYKPLMLYGEGFMSYDEAGDEWTQEVQALEVNRNKKEAEKKLMEFLRSDNYRVLVTSPVSREGVDYKGIKHLITLDAYVSEVSFMQLVGRILRTNNEKKSYLYLLLQEEDISLNALIKLYNLVPLSHFNEMIRKINNMLIRQGNKYVRNTKEIQRRYGVIVNIVD